MSAFGVVADTLGHIVIGRSGSGPPTAPQHVTTAMCQEWSIATDNCKLGGGSDAAIAALAPELDVFMLWGEPLKETQAFMERVTKGSAGRNPTFSLSTRPILAETEDKAWDRAHQILDRIMAMRGGVPAPRPENAGSLRLLAAAEKGEVHDSCLWTRLAVATGRAAIPPPWLARRIPWPRRWLSTTSSAPPVC